MTASQNSDYDWNWTTNDYLQGNYALLLPEDQRLSSAAIAAIANLKPEFGTARLGLHIGIGAVPRGSAFLAPLLVPAHQGGKIIMGDIGMYKVEATRRMAAFAKVGELGIWQKHQDHMTSCDARWGGAFQKAAQLGEVIELNMYDLPENLFDVASAEHLFESATEDKAEYEKCLRLFFRSVKPGGIVHMAYMVGSTGYTVNGRDFPAYPVIPDEVLEIAKKELTDIQNFFTSASHMAREEGDEHDYDGMGVLVGRRRR